MKTLTFSMPRSWRHLLLFDFLSGALVYELVRGFCDRFASGPLAAHPDQIGIAVAASWLIAVAFALRTYLGGVSLQAKIVSVALVAVPLATLMFVRLWHDKNPDLSGSVSYGLVASIAAFSASVSLLTGAFVVEAMCRLGYVLDPLFESFEFERLS